jgi:hypothetical protein
MNGFKKRFDFWQRTIREFRVRGSAR